MLGCEPRSQTKPLLEGLRIRNIAGSKNQTLSGAKKRTLLPSPFALRGEGRGLARDKVERAIKLSAEKYCSASAMLAKTATITHDFEAVETCAAAAG